MFTRRKIDYLIIGAQKSGTTSLHHYITAHLLVAPPRKKEVHFFDKHVKKGSRWYHRHFSWDKKELQGEATPYYIFDKNCPSLVHNYHKDIKIIAILRDPVERAFSHYRMNVERGDENLTFMEALQQEDLRITKDAKAMRLYSYKKRGEYASQLDVWYDQFRSEQILTLRYEDFFDTPWLQVQSVYRFLGLPAYYGSQQNFFSNRNKDNSPLPEGAKKYLTHYFAGPNQKLKDQYNIEF